MQCSYVYYFMSLSLLLIVLLLGGISRRQSVDAALSYTRRKERGLCISVLGFQASCVNVNEPIEILFLIMYYIVFC